MHHRSVDAIECNFFIEDFWGDYYFEAISKGIVESKTIIDSKRKFILQKKVKQAIIPYLNEEMGMK